MKSSQPVLFDKLSQRKQPIKESMWREILLRDIEKLLNDAARSGDLQLDRYAFCASSVLNYGLPSLSKQIPISADALTLAHHIHKILITFEPRLDPKTIQVIPVFEARRTSVLAILFDISGVFSIPGNVSIVNLRIALDYSCGAVQVL